jgi:hypothetical protein
VERRGETKERGGERSVSHVESESLHVYGVVAKLSAISHHDTAAPTSLTRSHMSLELTIVQDVLEGGEGIPSPMLSVTGLSLKTRTRLGQDESISSGSK